MRVPTHRNEEPYEKNNFIYAHIASRFCSRHVPIALPAGRQVSGGEMKWMKVDEEIFDHVVKQISRQDAKEQSRKVFPWRLVFNLCAFA